MKAILRKVKKLGCSLELSADPDRLDLLGTQCRKAEKTDALASFNTDAHSVGDYDNIESRVGQAGRGWLEPGDLRNTRPLPQLKQPMGAAKSR